MERYDYFETVENDLTDFIRDVNPGHVDDDRREKLRDDAFVSDSVTGNGSGSYTFSTWRAEECLCHNSDLLRDVLEETDSGYSDPESNDVMVRCHVLNEVFDRVVDKWNEEHPETEKEDAE